MKRFLIAMMVAAAVTACGSKGSAPQEVFEIGQAAGVDGLHAPWDGLDEGTVFRCFSDQDSFYFLYEVPEQTLTLTEPFLKERDVDPEDRVEIFFSPRLEMDIYYCAEIDPMGRVMDYKAKYYRDFDYDWNFAIKTIALPVVKAEDVPGAKFSYSCPVPSDCLRVVEILPSGGVDSFFIENAVGVPPGLIPTSPFRTEWFRVYNGVIYTHIQHPLLKYVCDEENVDLFDSKFIEAFSYKLAGELAMAVRQSETLMASMLNAYQAVVSKASEESQNEHDLSLSENPYVEARYGH